MVTLTNRTRTTLVFNLPHEYVCGEGEGECRCSKTIFTSLELNPKTGETGVRNSERQLCPSLHLHPGVESEPLPERVLEIPEIAMAISGTPAHPAPKLRVGTPAAAPALGKSKGK